MASPQFMKIRVTRQNVDPIKWGADIQAITATGMRKMADNLRDEMRAEYKKSIHKTMYGMYSSGYDSLDKYIVVSPKWSPTGVYEVGAMRNVVVGNKTVDEIFKYMDEGTGIYNGGKDGWWFELPANRASAGENGYWFTRGQEAKRFISGPAQKSLSTFQRESDVVFGPPIEAYLHTIMRGGK